MMRFMIVLVVALLLGTSLTNAPFVSASPAQTKVVSANPVNFTPQLPLADNTAAYRFAQVGNVMYVGGEFTSIGGVSRSNVASFNATTGAMLAFHPIVNGQVWSIVPNSDGTLTIGGTFTTVNGVARKGLAKINTTGAVVTAFNAHLTGDVFDGQLVNGRLIVSGTFSKQLVALNPTSGADTGYIKLAISGTVGNNAGPTEVYRFAVNPQNNRLVGIGNFTSVGGYVRYRGFMLNLGTTSATLSSWYYKPLNRLCAATANLQDYLRDVDFSPDGSYFAIASTGFVSRSGDLGLSICDAVARFETSILAPAKPTWINYTGGDTLHSVAITGAAVYVGGHNRWLNNPNGRDSCGTGCVARPGIGAINPTTGKALSWNPMRTRGVGAKALYVTAAGLWVGSDTGVGGKLGCSVPAGPSLDDCTGKTLETHAGIGFLPLN